MPFFSIFQAQYRRILSCRCTADTPQIDYSRYIAGRGQPPPGVLAATNNSRGTQSQKLQPFRAQKESQHLRTPRTEHMTLTELSAPPLRGIDSQVIVERPMDGEIEPFIRYKLERSSLIMHF